MYVVATGYGDESVLKLIGASPGEPARSQVAVEVVACGVNPVDRKRYTDPVYSRRRGEGPGSFPIRLGVEAAGRVTAAGPDAVGPAGPVSAGDEVIVYRVDGAYADALLVPASAVVPKPPRLGWPEAASLMLAGTTAVHCLTAVRARRGDTVLVHGASGAVGQSLLQLARLDGVHVVGTASARNFGRVRRYGAVPIPYGPGLAEAARSASPGGYDAVIDLAGTGDAIDVSPALVRDRSRMATIVASGHAQRAGFSSLGGRDGAQIRMAARLRLLELAQTGDLETRVARTFALQDVRAAHAALAAGGLDGKIVLTA